MPVKLFLILFLNGLFISVFSQDDVQFKVTKKQYDTVSPAYKSFLYKSIEWHSLNRKYAKGDSVNSFRIDVLNDTAYFKFRDCFPFDTTLKRLLFDSATCKQDFDFENSTNSISVFFEKRMDTIFIHYMPTYKRWYCFPFYIASADKALKRGIALSGLMGTISPNLCKEMVCAKNKVKVVADGKPYNCYRLESLVLYKVKIKGIFYTAKRKTVYFIDEATYFPIKVIENNKHPTQKDIIYSGNKKEWFLYKVIE